MTTAAWTLALVEVIFYAVTLLPMLYLCKTHLRPHTPGWPLIFSFLILQLVGSALTLKQGRDGPPSITGTIISGIGLSTQLLGLAGILHECALLAPRLLVTKEAKKRVNIAMLVYHVAVVAAVPIYAVGQSGRLQIPPKANAAALAKAGIALLLVLWVVLVAVTAAAARWVLAGASSLRPARYKGLFWAVLVATTLLGVRVVYQAVATLSGDVKYAAIGGDVVYAGCLQFLPSALVVLVLLVGGVWSRRAYEDSLIGESKVAAQRGSAL